MDKREIIQRFKGLPGETGLRLPIRDESLGVIGYHRTFDRALLSDGGLIRTMAECHTACKESFLTQFEVSAENKRHWLEFSVLPNDTKLLLLVETLDGRIVGQVGFTLQDAGFLLDATMRWARGGHPDLIHRSVVERCAVCFGLLGCDVGYAEVFADNELAVDRTMMLGFEVVREHSLHLGREGEKIVYAKENEPSKVNTKRRLVEMSIPRDRFVELHRNMIEAPGWSGFF